MKKQNKKKIKQQFIKSQKRNGLVGRIYSTLIDAKRNAIYCRYTKDPVDERLIVFEAFMGRKYTDSPRAIYEYLLGNEKFSDYRFVWCFRDSSIEKFRYVADNPRTDIVRWGSEDYYSVYARAGYWFANTRIPKALRLRATQKYVQCWHGTPLKRLGCDIISEMTEKRNITLEVLHSDVSRYSYLLSPSGFFSEKITSALDLKALGKTDIIIEKGYPRNDSIVNMTDEDAERIKSSMGISGKRVILYAPTYRENQKNSNGHYAYSESVDFDSLREKLGPEYIILFRAHYYVAQNFNFDKYRDFVIDVSDYPEINELYVVSDILITDYSSVFFDYGILRRPIIYYMYDLEFYRDEMRGFYLTTEELPGPIIREQEELERAILDTDEWFNTPFMQDKYKAFSERFTYLDDGHACERVVAEIFK